LTPPAAQAILREQFASRPLDGGRPRASERTSHAQKPFGSSRCPRTVAGGDFSLGPARRAPRPSLSKIELTGYGGYQFSLSSLSTFSGTLDIKDAVNYGGSIGIRLRPTKLIELTVNQTSTDLRLRRFNGVTELTPIRVTNFYLGGYNEVHNNNIRPFFGFGLGATWFNAQETFGDDWRFSFMLGGGVKVMFGEKQRVGLRLQGNLLMTFLSTSWGASCGGGGCGLGLFGTGVADLNFTAGLTVGLGDFWN